MSAEVASLVGGPGSLDTLLDGGIPLRFRGDGWGEWSDPVRDLLRVGAEPLTQEELRAVAARYAASGEATLGCLLLARSRSPCNATSVWSRTRRSPGSFFLPERRVGHQPVRVDGRCSDGRRGCCRHATRSNQSCPAPHGSPSGCRTPCRSGRGGRHRPGGHRALLVRTRRPRATTRGPGGVMKPPTTCTLRARSPMGVGCVPADEREANDERTEMWVEHGRRSNGACAVGGVQQQFQDCRNDHR